MKRTLLALVIAFVASDALAQTTSVRTLRYKDASGNAALDVTGPTTAGTPRACTLTTGTNPLDACVTAPTPQPTPTPGNTPVPTATVVPTPTPNPADVTDVWGCTGGNCSALTAASGDSLNAANADSTSACKVGTSAPAACTVGACFFDSDATAGSNLYGCTATDTWTLQAGGGGGGGGDITDVFGCSSGDCTTLTAASGDSLDMGSGDSSKPCERSATLPATCAEGDCYHDTDAGGTELYQCTATDTWTKLGPAITSASARVYNSGTQSLTTATLTALTFDSERYDTNSLHSTVSNTSRLTAPVAGKYRITGNVQFAANATGIRTATIRLNGTTYIGGKRHMAVTTAGQTTIQDVSTEYDLAASDYVELVVEQASGGNLNSEVAGNYAPEFMMSLIAGQ